VVKDKNYRPTIMQEKDGGGHYRRFMKTS